MLLATLCATLLAGSASGDQSADLPPLADSAPAILVAQARRHRRDGTMDEVPVPSAEAEALDKDMKARAGKAEEGHGHEGHGHDHPPRVMVYATGPGLTAAEAMAIEDPLVLALDGLDDVLQFAGTAAKLEIGGLDPSCDEPGACAELVALSMDAQLILTCTRSKKKLALVLRTVQSKEVIAKTKIPKVSASALAAKAGPALAKLVAKIPPSVRESHGAPQVAATETITASGAAGTPPATTWTTPTSETAASSSPPPAVRTEPSHALAMIPTTKPFWLAVGATGITLACTLLYSAQFEGQRQRYIELAGGLEPVNPGVLRRLEAQVRILADVGNALWVATAGVTAITIALAVLTEWWPAPVAVAGLPLEGGGGAVVGMDF